MKMIDMPVTEAEARVVLALRAMVIENLDAFRHGIKTETEAPTEVTTKQCPVQSPKGQCNKPMGHGQRHRYAPTKESRAAEAEAQRQAAIAARGWARIESVTLATGKVRKPVFIVTKGSVVSVKGKQGPWTVISIEQHRETGEVNVEVRNSAGRGHTYRLENIKYRKG